MAYLVLAHQDETQLDALLGALLPPDSPDIAIVHADKDSRLWLSLRDRPEDRTGRIRIIRDPIKVRWGHWSQVGAIARLVEAALEEGCDIAHLLSGADWPFAERARILTDIAREPEPLCHIEAVPGLQDDRMQTYRLDTRWLRLDPRRHRFAYSAAWRLRRISCWGDLLRTKLGLERTRPFGPWRKGSQWWSLPHEALDCLDHDLPRLLKSGRLRGTVCADEHAIPTIIACHFPDRLAGNRRFVDFPDNHSSPRILNRGDLPAILRSGAWFARKVSLAHDDFFLDPDALELRVAAEG